ncbi:MAG: hypothetical protein JSU72_19915, partial [Deltaproteobacteria bacterium]
HLGDGKNDAGEVHIYDTSTWNLERVIISEMPTALSFSPDDTMLVMIGQSGAVLWNWRLSKRICSWPSQLNIGEEADVAFFPDGRRLAIAGYSELKIINLDTNDIDFQEPIPTEGVPVAVSPDSRYVAMGSGYGHGEIKVLKTASWNQEPPLTGHRDWVSSLTFTASSDCLISSSADNTLRVWDMNRRDTTRVLKGHHAPVYSFSLASDEKRVVSGGRDGQILEWNLQAPPLWPREHLLEEKNIRQVVFSSDSQSFYTINKIGSISIWDAETFKKQRSFSPKLGADSSIILSPSGDHLIAGTGSGELCVWETKNHNVVAHRKAQSGLILPVGFSADGTFLVTLETENNILLWNASTWQLKSRSPSGPDIFRYNQMCSGIPADSDILLYPGDRDLIWWDLMQLREITRVRVHPRWSGSVTASPTEPLLASSCGDPFIYLWDWQTRQSAGQLRGLRSNFVVAFSADGRRLLSGSTTQGAITLWDVSTRQEISRFGKSSAQVSRIGFSPDLNTIFAVDKKQNAYFWRAPTFEEINDLEAQQRQTEKE